MVGRFPKEMELKKLIIHLLEQAEERKWLPQAIEVIEKTIEEFENVKK